MADNYFPVLGNHPLQAGDLVWSTDWMGQWSGFHGGLRRLREELETYRLSKNSLSMVLVLKLHDMFLSQGGLLSRHSSGRR